MFNFYDLFVEVGIVLLGSLLGALAVIVAMWKLFTARRD